MSFSENLKVLREEKNLSQEQLAELLDVSRQAVSKWENDSGYPETEKLIQIAQKLDVSLDSLLLDQQLIDDVVDNSKNDSIIFPVNKTISIKSKEGKYISAFYKFRIRKIVLPKKEGPNCMICGTNSSVFLGGDNSVEVGWYATDEDAHKELSEIYKAMQNGADVYQLVYTTDTKPRLFTTIV